MITSVFLILHATLWVAPAPLGDDRVPASMAVSAQAVVGGESANGHPPCLDSVAQDLATRCPKTMREYFRSRVWMPSETAITELDSVRAEVIALCNAVALDCEWGVDWYASAPEIGKLKDWISILDADSRRLERFSKRSEAAQCIVAMFDIARIVALIPRLDMQREASRCGWQSIQRAEQFLSLVGDPVIATRIGKAATAFAQTLEASSAQCVATERIRWLVRPLERIRLGADGASLYLSAQSEVAAMISKSNEYPLSRLKGEELQIELRAGESYFIAVAAAWKAPDATAQLSELSSRAERGEFGAWVAAARPDFLGVRSELMRGSAPLRDIRDQVSLIVARSQPTAVPKSGDEK